MRILRFLLILLVSIYVAKEVNKLLMQVKIGIRFHPAEITYFEINISYAYVKQIQQADYM